MAGGIINRRRLTEFIQNAGAFAVYLAVQQLLLLPFLARRCGEAVFCQAVLFLTVVNVTGSVLGDDAGNCMLVRGEEYRKKGLDPRADTTAILLRMGVLAAAVTVIANMLAAWDWWCVGTGIVCVWLCALRFYVSVQFRRQQRFDLLLWLGVVYALGMIPGALAFRCGGHWTWIFLGAELTSVLWIGAVARRNGVGGLAFAPASTEYGRSWAVYLQLAGVSVLLLGAMYLDRFMLYGMLEPAALAVYFAVSIMSKIIFMLGNPLYSFLLAMFSRIGSDHAGRVIRFGLLAGILLFAAGGVGALGLMIVGMKIFYPQYFSASVPLFPPLSAAAGAGMTVVVLRSLALRFCPKWQLLLNTAVYAAVLGGGGWVMTRLWGITGMGWAVAAGQLVQAVGLLWILSARQGRGENAV